ncbi:MAG TPA: hypothetical protein VEL28_00875 [Candidatus Binatia bacterium]|nr:hypothetical protein [Candidatus Binatia bacterium]
MHRASIMLAWLAAGAALWTAGCAGEGAPPAAPTTTVSTTSTTLGDFADLSEVQAQIFTPSCGFSGCHNTATRQGNLDLSSASVSHTQLVGVVSECAGKIRVVAGDPDASYLLHKVGDGPEPCGTLMPQLLPPLTPAQIELLRSWIRGGALPAGSSPASRTSTEGPTSSSSTTSSTQE